MSPATPTANRKMTCAFTAADSFGAGPIAGRTLADWERETRRLLATIQVNRRVDAARLAALEVHFADAREMATLNYRHLKHRGATDVLTFPLKELIPPGASGRGRVKPVAGVVIVCPPVAAREARARDLPAAEELLRYILHGVLHLLGENDKTPAARKRMHGIQEKLLTAWFARAAEHRPQPQSPLRPRLKSRARAQGSPRQPR